MVSTWLLLMSIGSGAGVAMDHIEFNSKVSCQIAGEKWAKMETEFPQFICIKKEATEDAE